MRIEQRNNTRHTRRAADVAEGEAPEDWSDASVNVQGAILGDLAQDEAHDVGKLSTDRTSIHPNQATQPPSLT
jgi:hypothetical protein